ncbi:hypothetical protein [Streptomyces sp. NPDC017993]|uniref:hypothetical protein n=1 Tax=Streptomyces sp. NPDC017993 TaxID=3365027 RepID=UPI0037ABB409
MAWVKVRDDARAIDNFGAAAVASTDLQMYAAAGACDVRPSAEPLVDGPLIRPYLKSAAYERDIRWLINRRNQPHGLRGMRMYDVINKDQRRAAGGRR